MKKRTVTFRQVIIKTVDVYGEDRDEINNKITEIEEDIDQIDIDSNFDDIQTDTVFIGEMVDA